MTATLTTPALSPKKAMYGKAGDRVTILFLMGEVAIVQHQKTNENFPVHQ